MKFISLLFFLSWYSGFSQTTFFTGGDICKNERWQLVFSDEFDNDSLDRNTWLTYYPCISNWQDDCESARLGTKAVYLDRNAIVSNGSLKLTAKHESASWFGNNRDYTS